MFILCLVLSFALPVTEQQPDCGRKRKVIRDNSHGKQYWGVRNARHVNSARHAAPPRTGATHSQPSTYINRNPKNAKQLRQSQDIIVVWK